MPNTLLTDTLLSAVGPSSAAQALTALQLIPLDLTLTQLWGLLPITDTPTNAGVNLSRVIQCQMTPTIADAAGTAVVAPGSPGAVASVTTTNQGGLYAAPPIITFTGGAPLLPAQGFASCQVRGCIVLLGGGGYSGATIVTFRGPLAPGGVPATGTVTVVGNVVTGIVMTNTGGPYLQQPDAIISDTGGGAGAEVVAGLSVSGITVTYGGTGYRALPTVVVTPLFKQTVPDASGNPAQQATLKGWMDGFIQNAMELPFKSTTTAS